MKTLERLERRILTLREDLRDEGSDEVLSKCFDKYHNSKLWYENSRGDAVPARDMAGTLASNCVALSNELQRLADKLSAQYKIKL